MRRGLPLSFVALVGVAACGTSAPECAADPNAVDEGAVFRMLSDLSPDQSLVDGPREASVRGLRDARLTFEGEKPLESDKAGMSLFSYISRTDPPVRFSIIRDARDPCYRHVSWRILDRQVAGEQ